MPIYARSRPSKARLDQPHRAILDRLARISITYTSPPSTSVPPHAPTSQEAIQGNPNARSDADERENVRGKHRTGDARDRVLRHGGEDDELFGIRECADRSRRGATLQTDTKEERALG